MEKYLLIHRDFGFLSDAATYTSEYQEAKIVDHETAIEFCRRYAQRDGFGELSIPLIPVRVSDVRRIAND